VAVLALVLFGGLSLQLLDRHVVGVIVGTTPRSGCLGRLVYSSCVRSSSGRRGEARRQEAKRDPAAASGSRQDSADADPSQSSSSAATVRPFPDRRARLAFARPGDADRYDRLELARAEEISLDNLAPLKSAAVPTECWSWVADRAVFIAPDIRATLKAPDGIGVSIPARPAIYNVLLAESRRVRPLIPL